MRHRSMPTSQNIAITAALTVAFCAETYVSSGWQDFRLESKSRQHTTGVATVDKGARDLKNMLDHQLQCDASKRNTISHKRDSRRLALWLSPYRRFPEVAPEGDARGKGDYEYLSYITNNKCGRIASNYGAFKKSPADQLFRQASKQGLRAELLLAQQLGYTLFALDTKKILLSKRDRDLCKSVLGACTETSDGFIVINLKKKAGLSKSQNFLLNSTRLGDGLSVAEAIEAHSITATPASQWHDWEDSLPGSAFRWSNGAGNQFRSVELLTPTVDGESPANVKTMIITSPSVRSLLVELDCARGIHSHETIAVQSTRDISELASSCHPRSARALSARGKNNVTMTGQAPQLGERDSRESWFGIMYQLH